MSLFKVYSGTRDEFPDGYPNHPGYAYFFKDDGIFMIDVDDKTRVTVNAPNIVKIIDQKSIVYDSRDILTTEGGFLGKNSLIATTDNNCVYEVSLNNGSILTKDKNGRFISVSGEGALYSIASEAPSFGTLPISVGGTGATTAADARSNLDVYSKSEVDAKTAGGASTHYAVSVESTDWALSDNYYIYNYSNTDLKCGSDGKVPPIIRCRIGQESYNKINRAMATAGSGIQFRSSEAITGNMLIDIIDVC